MSIRLEIDGSEDLELLRLYLAAKAVPPGQRFLMDLVPTQEKDTYRFTYLEKENNDDSRDYSR